VAFGGEQAGCLGVVAGAVTADRLEDQNVATVPLGGGGGATAEIGGVTDAEELVGIVDL
jgi:hypothetical protein